MKKADPTYFSILHENMSPNFFFWREMNSKVCLLFGALVTLSFLSAAGGTEDSLSGELTRAADTNPGRSKEKLKMAKRNKTAGKKKSK